MLTRIAEEKQCWTTFFFIASRNRLIPIAIVNIFFFWKRAGCDTKIDKRLHTLSADNSFFVNFFRSFHCFYKQFKWKLSWIYDYSFFKLKYKTMKVIKCEIKKYFMMFSIFDFIQCQFCKICLLRTDLIFIYN